MIIPWTQYPRHKKHRRIWGTDGWCLLKLKARIYEKRRKSLRPKSGTIEAPGKNTNNSEHLKSKTTLYSMKFRIREKNHCVQNRTIYNPIYIRANVNKTTRKSAWRKYKWIKLKLMSIDTHVHTHNDSQPHLTHHHKILLLPKIFTFF